RTSNKGMRDFEYLKLEGGSPPLASAAFQASSATPPVRRLYHAVGDKLAGLAAAHPGAHGYGAFGAVVGCTEREEAAEIRAAYPNLFFLIPGYGAQGGAADDAALLLREGNGGVVNASRSILKAWSVELAKAGEDPDIAKISIKDAAEAARRAVIEMRDAIRAAIQAAIHTPIHTAIHIAEEKQAVTGKTQ
ncbi:MAG: hypothetical protein FWF29_07275, partial [Treponema sp.]|nr:hypothetical protein [Treponema sp.]